MPEADLQFSSKLFLKALDASPLLQNRYINNHKKEWTSLRIFRDNFGDACSKVRGCLSLLWLLELTRDKAGFFQDLKNAQYDS